MRVIRLYKIVPNSLFNWISSQIIYADLDKSPEKFTNEALTNSFVLGIIVSIVSYFFLNFDFLQTIFLFFSVFLVAFGSILFLVMNMADSRGSKVEAVLPDALELIASNIRSGLTTEKAMLASSLPEFGDFSKEMINVSKELFAGEKIELALLGIPKRLKSNVVDRTIWLLIQGIKRGGQISNLLVRMGKDIREENALRAETNANVSMYFMLILVSAAIGAPALFGISSFIVGILSEQTSQITVDQSQMGGYASTTPVLGLVGGQAEAINEEFIVIFSIVLLIITSIFSSFVLGVIASGKEKGGIKYMPVIMTISLIVFFTVRIVIAQLFVGFV